MSIGKMQLQIKTKQSAQPNENLFDNRTYIRVKNLVQFINDLLDLIPDFRQDEEFENKIWLFFSGDKGGKSMKFHIKIVNDTHSGTCCTPFHTV